jgi:hypothetical protein
MPTVRIRYTAASNEDVNVLLHALEAIEGIEHVEEVADLMPHMDDDDSSSAGLVSDGNDGADVHDIEVLAPNDEGARRVRYVTESAAMDAGAVAEFLDEW